MVRIVNIVHFSKDGGSSKFVVDEERPAIVSKGDYDFVDDGCFYVTVEKVRKGRNGERRERITVKLSAAEAALTAVRLMEAVKLHATEYFDRQGELALMLESRGRGVSERGREE